MGGGLGYQGDDGAAACMKTPDEVIEAIAGGRRVRRKLVDGMSTLFKSVKSNHMCRPGSFSPNQLHGDSLPKNEFMSDSH